MHTSGTLKIDFPTKYNVGSTANADGTGEKMMTLLATKTVKIKVHSASLTDQFIMIDYLFETASLGQGKYFIYDPTITESKTEAKESKTAVPSPSTSSLIGMEGSGSVASVSALALGVAVSVVAVFLGSL